MRPYNVLRSTLFEIMKEEEEEKETKERKLKKGRSIITKLYDRSYG